MTLVPQDAAAGDGVYTVRLYFAEPDGDCRRGERVFDVLLQDRKVLSGFDVAKEAGGARREIVQEFSGVAVAKDLQIRFVPSRGETLICGLEILD